LVAPGKAAEAAARGKESPHFLFFFLRFGAAGGAKPEEEKEKRIFEWLTPGSAALARGYLYVVAPRLQLGSLRSHVRWNRRKSRA
jgi:hypothetical protein